MTTMILVETYVLVKVSSLICIDPFVIQRTHVQNYRDLDRAEGNLLKHMTAEIEWFDPPRKLLPFRVFGCYVTI